MTLFKKSKIEISKFYSIDEQMKFAKGVNLVKKADFNQIKYLLQSETSNENKLTNVNKHF